MSRWTAGNRVRRPENGEELLPRVRVAIDAARAGIPVGTFIAFGSKVGERWLAATLLTPVCGMRIAPTVNDCGSTEPSPAFAVRLDAGARHPLLLVPTRRVADPQRPGQDPAR